jgi:DNA topoisomerase-1
VALLAAAKPSARRQGRQLGLHPDDQKPVMLRSGRYGPYVSHHRASATLPKDTDPDKVTLGEAVALLAAKAAKAEKGEGKPAKGERIKAAAATAGTRTPRTRAGKKKAPEEATEAAPADSPAGTGTTD